MRSFIMHALAGVLIAGISVGTGPAQAASPDSYRQLLAGSGANGIGEPQRGEPGGDYKLTCRDIRRDGNVLKASCQKMDGGWRSTSLDTRNCRSQIVNDDGYLRCTQGGGAYGRPPGGGWEGGIPPGDYRQTCSDIRVNGQRLDASCQKVDGSWRKTSLENFSRCGDRISNVDGRLRCGQ